MDIKFWHKKDLVSYSILSTAPVSRLLLEFPDKVQWNITLLLLVLFFLLIHFVISSTNFVLRQKEGTLHLKSGMLKSSEAFNIMRIEHIESYMLNGDIIGVSIREKGHHLRSIVLSRHKEKVLEVVSDILCRRDSL